MDYLFEAHLTTHDLSETAIHKFETFCQSIAAKPILIELSKGTHYRQPMISKVFRLQDPKEIHTKIDKLVAQFKVTNYPVTRVKIEVPLNLETRTTHLFPAAQKTYFEWHGKITAQNWEAVRTIALPFGGHLSKNALKKNPHAKFITIRDYESAISIQQRVGALKTAMKENNWSFTKEEFEYCIYDSNEALDSGWIN